MEFNNFHIDIPTWDNGVWTTTEYNSLFEFRDFVKSVFREPGKYDFDNTSKLFNEQARLFNKNGYYCNAPFKTKDFFTYWDDQKKKNVNGVIFKNNDKIWYLPRDYYFWINFLPIYDKIKKNFDFPQVWDVQLHMSLYELLAELNFKHSVIVKKRQIASSYFHCAKLINKFWFDEGSVLKMGASLKKYVNLEGSWKYLEEYKNFLNTNTAWYRPLNPSKEGNWQQKIEVNQNGKIVTKGLKSSLMMTSFEKSETSGVGGPCHRIGTKIIMSDGKPKSVENIKIGDYILGIDSKPKIVTNTFLGQAPMYKIEPIKGSPFYATGEHILALYTELFDVEVNMKVSDWNNLTDTLKNYLFQKRKTDLKENDSFELIPIKSITLQNYGCFEQYAGIEVEDSHYFLDDFTITHNCSFFYHEEAGIAPKMDKTYIYLKSALEMGDITTGMFIAAGSVGELKDCGPLKDFILHPEENGFYGVETDLADEKGSICTRGLFIPEQWGMPPYIDDNGNSMVKEALEALDKRFEKLKKEKDPASYQLEISQHPRNINEAFAYRDISIFPTSIIEGQKHAIDNGDYPYELVDLEENIEGKIIVRQSNRSPINQWPVKKTLEDKRGSIQVWERPDEEPIYNEYIASIDPVKVNKTTTSESLCSIYVYKCPIRVRRETSLGIENYIEGDKIVCCWVGRFDNPKETNKQLELILKWYKCRAIVEANVAEFINYMMEQNLAQRYLVRKDEILFLKEYNLNTMTYNDYGWKNTGTMFKQIMLPMLISWIQEVVNEEFDENGVSIKKTYGISRIPDIMALNEMIGYKEDVNVDRLIALTALVCFIKIQEANHLTPTKHEVDDNLEKNNNLYKLKISPFSNRMSSGSNIKKNPFSKLW